MELGEKIKQARLEARLSQRQLCGQRITRNMLSQIENGAASPSMDTLRYLAGRLGRPVAWFLEENVVTSPNVAILEKARALFTASDFLGARQALAEYDPSDHLFDQEAILLRARCCLRLAERCGGQQANSLLDEAAEAAEKSIASSGLRAEILACRAWLCRKDADRLEKLWREAMSGGSGAERSRLRITTAHWLLQTGQTARAEAVLRAEFPLPYSLEAYCLLGEALFLQKRYKEAAEQYLKAEAMALPEEKAAIYRKLEQCYLAVEDYKNAYFYAKKA